MKERELQEALDPNTETPRLWSSIFAGYEEAYDVLLQAWPGNVALRALLVEFFHEPDDAWESLRPPCLLNLSRPISEQFQDVAPQKKMGLSPTKANQLKELLTAHGAQITLIQRELFFLEESRAVAKNPQLPPKLIEKLMQCADEEIQQNLAMNPSLDRQRWSELAQRYPRAATQNIAIPLWLIEDPSFLDKLSHTLIEGFLQESKAPESIALYYLDDPSWQRMAAQNQKTCPKYLRILAESDAEVIRIWVARNPSTPIDVMHALGKDSSERVCQDAKETLDEISCKQNVG
jgi:hypothetical protein